MMSGPFGKGINELEEFWRLLSPDGWPQVGRTLAYQAAHSPVLAPYVLAVLLWGRARLIELICGNSMRGLSITEGVKLLRRFAQRGRIGHDGIGRPPRRYAGMGQATSSLGTVCGVPAAAVLPPVLVLMLAANVFADTDVYRCIGPDGKVEFRQTACAIDAKEDEIRIDARKTGWDPTPTQVDKKTKGPKKSRSREHKAVEEDTAQVRQQQRCWKKRQLLDEVNWKLRRGYKPAMGVKLRRRRRL
jgi:hypothetical protein